MNIYTYFYATIIMINHVRLIHILFSGPVLIYVGLVKPEQTWLYNLLGITGLFLLLSFLLKLLTQKPFSQRHVYFAIHALLFAPLLIYLGIKKINAPDVVFSLTLAIGLSAFGYHAIRLLQG